MILTTLKLGKNEYTITEKDKFCANYSSVALLSRAKTNPELKAKHIKQINKFERVQHDHEFGSSISIFSLKQVRNNMNTLTKEQVIKKILESGAKYVKTSVSRESCAVAIAIRDIECIDDYLFEHEEFWFEEFSTGLDEEDY